MMNELAPHNLCYLLMKSEVMCYGQGLADDHMCKKVQNYIPSSPSYQEQKMVQT